MAVSGGHTPWVMLRAWRRKMFPGRLFMWCRWTSESRPLADPDRNLTHLRESLLEHAPLRPEQIYAMPVEASDLEAASARTRGLSVGSPARRRCLISFTWDSDPTATPLRWFLEIRFSRSKMKMSPSLDFTREARRMTLTYPIINRSRLVLWVVTGSEKVGMLARLHAGDTSIPAGRVRADYSVILADRAAAGQADKDSKAS